MVRRKQSLVIPGGSWKIRAESNVFSGGPAHEVSQEKEDSIHWASGHSCDILVKTLVAFFPCSGNLPEAELESNGFISLVGENFKTA